MLESEVIKVISSSIGDGSSKVSSVPLSDALFTTIWK